MQDPPRPKLQGPLGASRLDKAQKATRLLCLMALFAFASFAFVDPYMVEGSVLPLYGVRLALIAFCIGLYWLSARPGMKVHAYRSGAVICMATGAGVVVLTEMTGGSSSLYWTMLMLTFFTASLIMPFRPLQAALVFVAIAGFYDVWMLTHDAVSDVRGWVLSNAGVWLSLFVSVLAVFFIDDLRDREDADRQRLEQLNDQLREEISEREKAEIGLRRTQQLDAAGRLAAGVAHELNNVLLVISGSAELIQRRVEGPDKLADRILESAQRGAKLTSDMLLFARKGHREDHPFSLNDVVRSVAEAVGDTQAKATRVETNLAAPQPWVSGDRQQLSQALLNLCLNGLDAMETPGVLSITTKLDGVRVAVTVSDSGQGMTDEVRERAFEPFYTTKAPGKGTGLGLSMVYGIIKDHGGAIDIDSVPGQGTSVCVLLPLTTAPEIRAEEVAVADPTPFKGTRVLLVDDDELVRRLMTENLEENGFVVTEAENGLDALAHITESQPAFDLIILDMVMPVMSGSEAYARVRQDDPRQRILLYSGHTPEETLAEILEHPQTQFLRKPFRQQKLLDTMGQLLTSR